MTKRHVSITLNESIWNDFVVTAEAMKRSRSDLLELLLDKANHMTAEELILFLHDLPKSE